MQKDLCMELLKDFLTKHLLSQLIFDKSTKCLDKAKLNLEGDLVQAITSLPDRLANQYLNEWRYYKCFETLLKGFEFYL